MKVSLSLFFRSFIFSLPSICLIVFPIQCREAYFDFLFLFFLLISISCCFFRRWLVDRYFWIVLKILFVLFATWISLFRLENSCPKLPLNTKFIQSITFRPLSELTCRDGKYFLDGELKSVHFSLSGLRGEASATGKVKVMLVANELLFDIFSESKAKVNKNHSILDLLFYCKLKTDLSASHFAAGSSESGLVFCQLLSIKKVRSEGSWHAFLSAIFRLRSKLRFAVRAPRDMHLAEEAGLLLALIDGDRLFVNEAIRRNYIDAGVAHLLALSGMHLGLLIAIFIFLLKPFTLRPIALIMGACVAPFYALFAGASPSLVRSSIMLIFLLFYRLKGGEIPLLKILALSLPLSLLLQPDSSQSASLILSYLALAGIILFEPFFLSAFKLVFHKKIAALFSVAYAAQFATAWWVYPNFGKIASSGVFASVVLTPLTFILMFFGLFFLIASLLGLESISILILKLGYPFYWLNEKLLYFFSQWFSFQSIFLLIFYFFPILLLSILLVVIRYFYERKRFL